MPRRELLIGAGHEHTKRLAVNGKKAWDNLTTLDLNPDTKPDVVYDLEDPRMPFKSDIFDEIHAYEVLEHVGTQGDYRFFFREFDEFARILKPHGHFVWSSPAIDSQWLWGDPGHTRHVDPLWFVFLSRDEYHKQLGKTAMSDYRSCFVSDWKVLFHQKQGESNFMVLENLK